MTPRPDRAEHDSERTYRRGVHQALYSAYLMAMKSKSIEEARRVIGLAADEAQEHRNQPILRDVPGGLIDAIERRVAAMAPHVPANDEVAF